MLSGCDPTVDIAIVLDSSSSVTEPNFQLMLDFAKRIIYHARVDTGHQRLAALSFSSDVHVNFYLKDHSSRAAAYWAMDRIRYRLGSSNLGDALRTLRNEVFTPANGDRPDASNIAVVITDGDSSVHQHRTAMEARLLRSAGTRIYVIGVDVADRRELTAVASSPADEHVFSLPTFSGLSRSLREKLSFCNEKLAATTGIGS